jgi:hypothetical protein
MPSILCTKKNLKKKQKAFNELRTTSHYPCDIKLFTMYPNTFGGEIPVITQIEKPILNDFNRF